LPGTPGGGWQADHRPRPDRRRPRHRGPGIVTARPLTHAPHGPGPRPHGPDRDPARMDRTGTPPAWTGTGPRPHGPGRDPARKGRDGTPPARPPPGPRGGPRTPARPDDYTAPDVPRPSAPNARSVPCPAAAPREPGTPHGNHPHGQERGHPTAIRRRGPAPV